MEEGALHVDVVRTLRTVADVALKFRDHEATLGLGRVERRIRDVEVGIERLLVNRGGEGVRDLELFAGEDVKVKEVGARVRGGGVQRDAEARLQLLEDRGMSASATDEEDVVEEATVEEKIARRGVLLHDVAFAHEDKDVCEDNRGRCAHRGAFALMEKASIELEVVVVHHKGESLEEKLSHSERENVRVLGHEQLDHLEAKPGRDVRVEGVDIGRRESERHVREAKISEVANK